jgi:hypothetical protein
MRPVTERAQEIVDATMDLSLRPQKGDRQKVVAAVLRAAADRLCTDLGELECPIDKLREIADEVEALGKVETQRTLTDLIYDWWEDVFTVHSGWDMETSIEHLVNDIEAWLPKEQSAAGSQNVYVECTVEGFNDALNKVKRNLR